MKSDKYGEIRAVGIGGNACASCIYRWDALGMTKTNPPECVHCLNNNAFNEYYSKKPEKK